jgi:ClpP class serine protease
MDESLTRDLYEQLVRGIADSRKKNEGEVRTLLDDGPFLPEEALRVGLIDDVAYEDQVDDKLRGGERRSQIDGDDYARISTTSLGLDRGPRIAVIHAAGAITGGKSASIRSTARPRDPIPSSNTSAAPGATARCARSCCASTAPAARRRPRTRSGAS